MESIKLDHVQIVDIFFNAIWICNVYYGKFPEKLLKSTHYRYKMVPVQYELIVPVHQQATMVLPALRDSNSISCWLYFS